MRRATGDSTRNWVAGVFARIGDVSIYWLVLALL
jgi:hypothetical protein